MHGKINEPPPSNHFVMALVTFVCCCWPISLGALIKSDEVIKNCVIVMSIPNKQTHG